MLTRAMGNGEVRVSNYRSQSEPHVLMPLGDAQVGPAKVDVKARPWLLVNADKARDGV